MTEPNIDMSYEELYKRINKHHVKIEKFRVMYKVPKRARDIRIIQSMLYRDFGIKIPMTNKLMNGYYHKGKFAELIRALLGKAYISAVIVNKKKNDKNKLS